MIAHADSQAAGNPPHDDTENQGLPGEKEEGTQCAEVQRDHDGGHTPIDWLTKGAVIVDKGAEAHAQINSITKAFACVGNQVQVVLFLTCRPAGKNNAGQKGKMCYYVHAFVALVTPLDSILEGCEFKLVAFLLYGWRQSSSSK